MKFSIKCCQKCLVIFNSKRKNVLFVEKKNKKRDRKRKDITI